MPAIYFDGLLRARRHALPQIDEVLIYRVDPDKSDERIFNVENNVNRRRDHDTEGDGVDPMTRFASRHRMPGKEGSFQRQEGQEQKDDQRWMELRCHQLAVRKIEHLVQRRQD